MEAHGHRSLPQIGVLGTRTTASVGSWIFGSGRSSTRTSPAPYTSAARIRCLLSGGCALPAAAERPLAAGPRAPTVSPPCPSCGRPRRGTAQIADSVCPPRAAGRELLSLDAHRTSCGKAVMKSATRAAARRAAANPATPPVPRTGAQDTHDRNVPFSATRTAMRQSAPIMVCTRGRVARGTRECGAAPFRFGLTRLGVMTRQGGGMSWRR